MKHNRIVFVHIPKTSGSAINAYLHACSPFGLTHLEDFESDPSLVDLRTADWLSAHMSPQRLAPFLLGSERDDIWFSIVRHPRARLISQINWALEIIARGPNALSNHDRDSLDFIMQVAGTDFTNPFSVTKMLLTCGTLLTNMFARYLLFSPAQDQTHQPDEAELRASLSRYAFIAWEGTRNQLIAAFDFHGAPPENKQRVNVSSYHFDRAIFDDPVVRPYVDGIIETDMRVYDLVREIFVLAPPATGRQPCYPLATDKSYSDEAYLAANPDVREAVNAGIIPSARKHFDIYGRGEGRRLCLSASPEHGWRAATWQNPPAHLE